MKKISSHHIMNIEYQHQESSTRGYLGISFEEEVCKEYLTGPVKDNLIDREERDSFLGSLRTLEADTGFSPSNELIEDIQALEDEDADVQNFRIGEAYAEVILEQDHQCRFHWNEQRDARNPKGNKTGADIVGFIEINGQISFLFGEVKTSSETATIPPQVMTYRDGIENQLKDLNHNRNKRLILISYLKNKARLYDSDHPFRKDFDQSIQSYYRCQSYQLIGVLVRDVQPNERDLSVSYERLSQEIVDPTGLQLLALYIPLNQNEWLGIINQEEQ